LNKKRVATNTLTLLQVSKNKKVIAEPKELISKVTRKIVPVTLNEVVELQIRTVATILVWIVAALLIINLSLKSEWIWLLSIALA